MTISNGYMELKDDPVLGLVHSVKKKKNSHKSSTGRRQQNFYSEKHQLASNIQSSPINFTFKKSVS